MATTAIKVQTEINEKDKFITIRDVTEYETDERETLGFAVFLLKDDSVVDGSIEEFLFDTWTFELPSTGDYQVEVFGTPIYSGTTNYKTGDIVIAPPNAADAVGAENKWAFYISTADGNSGNNPADGVNWTKLTSMSSAYTQFSSITSGAGYEPIEGLSYNAVDDLELEVTKTACKEFTITNPGSTIYFDIYDFENYINELTALNSSRVEMVNGDYSLDLDTYSVTDGIYVMVFYESSSSEEPTGYLVLYEYCEAKECFKSLVSTILCCSDDECDSDPCTGSEIYKGNTQFREALRLSSLFMTFIGYVFSEETKYLYATNMSEDRKVMLNSANELMDKLKVLVGRCGSC